jgi:hypothetical protein
VGKVLTGNGITRYGKGCLLSSMNRCDLRRWETVR